MANTNDSAFINGSEVALFKAVTESLPAFIYLQAPDYTIRYSNKYFDEHIRKTDPGKFCYEIIHNRNKPCDVCPTFKVFETKKPQVWEWTDSAHGRTYEIHDYPFTDKEGSQMVLEMGIDITPRKEFEEELKGHSNHYQNLFTNNHSIMLLIDPENGSIADANPVAAEFYGYTIKKLKDLSISDINVLPADQVFTKLKTAKAQKKSHYIFKHRLKDGEVKDVEVYSGPLQINGKEFLLSIIHDITHTVEVEESLRQINEMNHLLLSSVNEGIYGIDREGNTMFLNPAAERMLGFKKNELLGKNNHTLIHHTKSDGNACPLKSCKMYQTTVTGSEHFVTDEILWKKDGTSFPVEYHSTPILKDGELSGTVVTFRDISARNKNEAEKEKLIKDLQQALSKVKLLSGFIPICANCKNIRDDKGFWKQIESYIKEHSEAEFSHSICPDCAKELYPFLDLDLK